MGNNMTKERLLLLKKEYSRMPEGSLQFRCSRGRYYFFHYINSKQIPINKNPALIYKLARKKYLSYQISKRNENDISKLLDKYIKAGLVLQRITLSPKQYKWAAADYPKNTGWKENIKYKTSSGISMRSKSERDIGNELELHAVPYRYDMLFDVDVTIIVNGLRDYLSKDPHWRYNPRLLFTYRDGYCIWNVPEDLQWMNAPGSIWRSYNYNTNTITISVDFTIMLSDGSLLLWEHAGLCLNPIYRCNTSERIFVLRSTNIVPSDNIIFTTENDVLDIKEIATLIENKIVTRI